MMKLNPLTRKKIRRFQSIRRGYYSLIIFLFMIGISLFAELLINSRALVVSYEGQLYFPTYGEIMPGEVFGLDYEYETNYRELQTKFRSQKSKNWVLMPIVPYGKLETDLKEDTYPPFAPSFAEKHYLGTDNVGRDIVARLVYGFRIAIVFSLILLLVNYSVGVSIGIAMGYWGGKFDLFF